MTPESSIVFLPVSSLEAVREFYGGCLGLELTLDQGSCLIFRVGVCGFWGFCQADAPHEDPSKTILTLVTDKVDDWFTLLSQNGVTTDAPPRENPRFQIYHFFAMDPSGYRLEVQRFLDPRWHG